MGNKLRVMNEWFRNWHNRNLRKQKYELVVSFKFYNWAVQSIRASALTLHPSLRTKEVSGRKVVRKVWRKMVNNANLQKWGSKTESSQIRQNSKILVNYRVREN